MIYDDDMILYVMYVIYVIYCMLYMLYYDMIYDDDI